MLERALGVTLNDYMQKNIFEPLGLKNINMFPTPAMKVNLAHMNCRQKDGKLARYDHIQRRPLIVESKEDIKNTLNSGGAGCFAKPQEYARKFIENTKPQTNHLTVIPEIIATLLNDGKSPTTGAQILAPETVAEMFKNQIPQFPDLGRQGIPDSKPWLTNPLPDLYPIPKEKGQGWGLSFMLTGGPTGRSEGTAFWAGLANLWWWADKEKGVGGFIATQILPFADAKVLGLWFGVETAVYNALQ